MTQPKPCEACEQATAVWWYMPSDGGDRKRFFCEGCVSRGCSCNIIDQETGDEERDELGRLLPCCEYDYNEEGWEQ